MKKIKQIEFPKKLKMHLHVMRLNCQPPKKPLIISAIMHFRINSQQLIQRLEGMGFTPHNQKPNDFYWNIGDNAYLKISTANDAMEIQLLTSRTKAPLRQNVEVSIMQVLSDLSPVIQTAADQYAKFVLRRRLQP
jgi:hypothetical protein